MTTTSTPVHDPGETTQLRHIPLSRIVVPDGFNPRGEIVETASSTSSPSRCADTAACSPSASDRPRPAITC